MNKKEFIRWINTEIEYAQSKSDRPQKSFEDAIRYHQEIKTLERVKQFAKKVKL